MLSKLPMIMRDHPGKQGKQGGHCFYEISIDQQLNLGTKQQGSLLTYLCLSLRDSRLMFPPSIRRVAEQVDC